MYIKPRGGGGVMFLWSYAALNSKAFLHSQRLLGFEFQQSSHIGLFWMLFQHQAWHSVLIEQNTTDRDCFSSSSNFSTSSLAYCVTLPYTHPLIYGHFIEARTEAQSVISYSKNSFNSTNPLIRPDFCSRLVTGLTRSCLKIMSSYVTDSNPYEIVNQL